MSARLSTLLVLSSVLCAFFFAAPLAAQAPFELAGPFPMPLFAGQREVADLDGDTHVDLVFTHLGSTSTTILYGDGAGNMSAPVFVDVPVLPSSVTSGDFDGDGIRELVFGAIGTPVLLYFEVVGGVYMLQQDIPLPGLPTYLTSRDFDDDGNADLAVAMSNNPVQPGTVSILLGNGLGGFSPPLSVTVGANPIHLAPADFNGDGALDLAVAAAGVILDTEGEIDILLGDGTGSLAPPIVVEPGHAMSIAVGDLDGNGTLDLAAIYSFAAFGCGVHLRTFLADGSGGYSPSQVIELGCGPATVAVKDFDSDGNLDLLTGDSGDLVYAAGIIHWYPGDGSGIYVANEDAATGVFTIIEPAVADYDEDGHPDFALPGHFESSLFVYLNRLSTTFVRGDGNADGAIDISDVVTILDFLFGGSSPLPCDDAGDVNDDGQLDVSDAIYELAVLFSMGPPIPEPNPGCGADPSGDLLGCAAFASCP